MEKKSPVMPKIGKKETVKSEALVLNVTPESSRRGILNNGPTTPPVVSENAKHGREKKTTSTPALDPKPGSNGQMQQETTISTRKESDDNLPVIDPDEYCDLHKMVLQVIIHAGFLDIKGIKECFKQAAKVQKCKLPEGEYYYEYIAEIYRKINEKIAPFKMRVHSTACEITKKRFYVFLITNDDPVLRHQTMFTKAELALFNKMKDEMLQQNNFAISDTQCLNLIDDLQLRGFTKQMAQDCLIKMMTMGYFVKVFPKQKKNYLLTLGFRTIREFEFEFLEQDHYANVFSKCCICKNILLNGFICRNTDCWAAIHRHCAKKYLGNLHKKCEVDKTGCDKSCQVCPNDRCKLSWKDGSNNLVIRTRDDVRPPIPAPKDENAEANVEPEMPVLEPMAPLSQEGQENAKEDGTRKKNLPRRCLKKGSRKDGK